MSSTWERLFGSAGRRPEPGANEPPRPRPATNARPDPDREALERELAWRREQDERELEQSLRETEVPPRPLSEEEAWAEGGGWLSVASSNVAAVQYHADDERLLIEYKDGSVYAYHPVSMPLAVSLFRAPSKGRWVWDNLRVRGTVFGYQVPYELLSGPSLTATGQEARRWMRSEETRRRHGRIGPSGRDAAGGVIRPSDV